MRNRCLVCDNPIASHAPKGQRYCSRACAARARTAAIGYHQQTALRPGSVSVVCVRCGREFTPDIFHTRNQRYCSAACRNAKRRSPGPLRRPDDRRCRCGAEIPVTLDRIGRPVRRTWCDSCREDRARRLSRVLPGAEDVPRCVDCGALVGVEWGTVLALDADGRCNSCRDWTRKHASWLRKRRVRLEPNTPAEARAVVRLAARALGLPLQRVYGRGRNYALVRFRLEVVAYFRRLGMPLDEAAKLIQRSPQAVLQADILRRVRPDPEYMTRIWRALDAARSSI